MSLELGRFLELSRATSDIAASVAFYERLGFGQLITGDAWRHRYGVISDGRLHLGLHEWGSPALAVAFVLPGLASAQARLRERELAPEAALLGDEELHQLRLRDPGDNALLLLEARTFSPTPLSRITESVCGYFQHLSLPQSDFEAARAFWERAGLIALPEERAPYPHLPLTSDELSLAFHAPALARAALLVFVCPDLEAARARLRERGVRSSRAEEAGVTAPGTDAVLINAPEGTSLLLVPAPE